MADRLESVGRKVAQTYGVAMDPSVFTEASYIEWLRLLHHAANRYWDPDTNRVIMNAHVRMMCLANHRDAALRHIMILEAEDLTPERADRMGMEEEAEYERAQRNSDTEMQFTTDLQAQLAECLAAREQAEQEAANLYKQRIDAKLCIEQLMAEAGVLRGALENARDMLHAGLQVRGDALTDIAVDMSSTELRMTKKVLALVDAALASDAGENAAAVLAAVRCLLAARSWDVMGQEFLALKAAFAAMEKGDADRG